MIEETIDGQFGQPETDRQSHCFYERSGRASRAERVDMCPHKNGKKR